MSLKHLRARGMRGVSEHIGLLVHCGKELFICHNYNEFHKKTLQCSPNILLLCQTSDGSVTLLLLPRQAPQKMMVCMR